MRYDHYSDFGSTTNPRVALVWETTDALTTKLLYGSAFRAPSFSEQYIKNNPVSLGNPDLKPEKINTEELSFNYHATDSLQTTLTLFKYQAREMIDFVPDTQAPSKTAQNIHDVDGKGFEFELNWVPTSEFRLTTSYSWQDAKDCQTQTPVASAPGKQIKLNANWEFASNWLFNSQIYWVGDRKRSPSDTRSMIDDYALMNATVHRHNLLPKLDVSLAVRNVANANAREPSAGDSFPIAIPDDYPLTARSIWLEFIYAIK